MSRVVPYGHRPATSRPPVKSTLHARHLEPDERLKGRIERKLARLDRVADPNAHATVELTARASRVAAHAHLAEIILVSQGATIRSEATGATPIAAFDAVLDKVERQLVRTKQRQREPRREPSATGWAAPPAGSVAPRASGSTPSAVARRVVEIDRVDMVPMFPEDAINRMEELDQSFFVFLHARSGRVNVAYRLSGGGYGVIDPVVKGRPAVSRR